MPIMLPTEVTAAFIGGATGVIATFLREWHRERRRRKNVASALLSELRVYKRAVSNLITASKQEAVIYGQGFSQVLFLSVINEIADMGPSLFLDVRSAYSYLGQLDYVIRRFERRHSLPPVDAANLIPAYLKVCSGADRAVDKAIDALRPYAHGSAAKLELPTIQLTEEEERLFGGGSDAA